MAKVKARPQIDMFPELPSKEKLEKFYESSSLLFKWKVPIEELTESQLEALRKAYRVYRKFVPEEIEN